MLQPSASQRGDTMLICRQGMGHISPERLRVAAQIFMLLLGIPVACLQSYTKVQTLHIHIAPRGQELPADIFRHAAAGTPSMLTGY